ncbi:MAG: hypothetical protein OHK93_004169 [Ramalina farinacea]|uniref:PB1 domain-containing protein n=1 Tax=Ramalina farinacea TaxID=258253 RepID=A0AA43QG96_9LECA|nr:hypothetical protein [Ramalina farinacea]
MKYEIETWVTAASQYDNHEFDQALETFEQIANTAAILFNCGMINATLGQHEKAVECFQKAIKRDQYFAIAYFQQGVSNFLVGDFEEALANFNDTLLYLRGNTCINYEQLGLKYKLYSCEVLFNRGLCYIYLKQKDIGMVDLRYAAQEKQTPEHDVIDEAIQEDAEEFTVFCMGVGLIYRPSAAKVKNLKTRDYLGRARLIATADQSHVAAPDAKKAALQAAAGRSTQDRLPESVSFAASNLVRPNLHSRSRQQSEPPLNRNVFPPTPPPENENEKLRPTVFTTATSPPQLRAPSIHSISSQDQKSPPPSDHPLRPAPLKLSTSSFTSLDEKQPAPRIGTTRSASERPSYREPPRRDRDQRQQPRRLFMETTPLRHFSDEEADIDEHPDEELYSPPSTHSQHRHTGGSSSSYHGTSDRSHPPPTRRRHHHRSRSRGARRTHYSIEEEDENVAAASSPSSSSPEDADPDIFNKDTTNLSISASRKVPDLRNLRIKLHYRDDTRFIMLPPTTAFETFVEKVREKLKVERNTEVKVKVRDEEGDLITMGDADDWEIALESVRKGFEGECAGGGGDVGGGGGGDALGGMGKMEVWVV